MSSASKILCFLVLFAAAPSLYAANPCLTGGFPQPRDGTGTGGTGHGPLQEDGSGMGGTGLRPWVSHSGDGHGTGGTGHGPLQENGTGGTGHAPLKEAMGGNGMGGTGNSPSPDGNGTGGTGHDIVVEGVITGFASVCVNGLELHYQPTTPVAINGQAGSPKDLAVGQVVRAQTKGTGDQLAISRMQVRHLMVAPLQGIGDGRAQAMGQTIVLDKAARIPTNLNPGQKVAISGFVSAGGVIIATRLDAAPADSPDSITGDVSQNAKGRTMIAGVPIEGLTPDLKSGESLRAEGRYSNGRFQAERMERDDSPPPADRFVIQGPVKETGRDKLKIGSNELALDQAKPAKQDLPKAGQWVRIEGQRRGRELVIEKIEIQERILPSHNEAGERSQKHPAERAKQDSRSSTERSERTENKERPEKAESEKHEAAERPEIEKSESREKPEKGEAPEKPEKGESPEKPEKVEKPEKPEKVEKPEKPEKIERPEIERPEYD
jgi:hypothetical protein